MKKNIVVIVLYLLCGYKISAQNININVEVLNHKPLTFIDPLILSFEVKNNTNDTLLLPDLFCCGLMTKFKYWQKEDTFLFNNGESRFMYDDYNSIILPKSNLVFNKDKYFNNLYFVNWKKKIFLLPNKNLHFYGQIEHTYLIGNKKYNIVSNVFEFRIEKMNKNDVVFYKNLQKLGNPLDYIYATGEKEKYDEILNNCNILVENYKSNKFTPYILRTISSVYEVYLMEADFNDETNANKKEIFKKAEVHFTKLLSSPNNSDYQKQLIKQYQEEYRKRTENEKL